MNDLTARALILLVLGVTLVTILSVEATVNDEDDIKSAGHHHEGASKLIQKRATEEESSDERPHKRKSRKRKLTTTAAPNPTTASPNSTTASPNSTTKAPSSNSTSTTVAPSSNSSSNTPSPTSTTTSSPSTTTSSISSTTPRAATPTSTSTHSPSTSTLASLISGDFNKDPIDIDRMDDLVKTQNEEYELIKKAAMNVKDWAKWLHEHHGKSLNPMSAHKYLTFVRTLCDYYFHTDTSRDVVTLPKSQSETIDMDEKHINRMYPRRELYKLYTKI